MALEKNHTSSKKMTFGNIEIWTKLSIVRFLLEKVSV